MMLRYVTIFSLIFLTKSNSYASIIQNKGQLRSLTTSVLSDALYYYQGNHQTMYFFKDRVEIIFHNYQLGQKSKFRKVTQTFKSIHEPIIEGRNHDPILYNYFDRNGKKIRTSTCQEIVYKNMYPGIDLQYVITEKGMKSNWLVSPGADYKQIQFEYSGAISSMTLNKGALQIGTELGTISESAPITFNMHHKFQESRYMLDGNRVHFDINTDNPDQGFIIDPLQLVSSTFIGGSNEDYQRRVMANPVNSYVYILGRTLSPNYIATDALDTTFNGNYDITLSIYDPVQIKMVKSCFFGGSASETPYEWAMDKTNGDIVVVGMTQSSNFPIQNAFQDSIKGNMDGVVFKIDQHLDSLYFSSYLGGSGMEHAYAVGLVQETKNIYVGGATSSSNFPLLNPYQNSLSGFLDGFISKFSPTGQLLSSTYVGGSGEEEIHSIDIIPSPINDGIPAFVGLTTSNNLPITGNAIDQTYNYNGIQYNDAMIGIFDGNTNAMQYLTYYGSSKGNDWGEKIKVDEHSSELVVTGYTNSDDLPLHNAFDSTFNGGLTDIYLLRINIQDTIPVFATYYGGSGVSAEVVKDLYIDPHSKSIYLCGFTENSSGFPIVNPYKSGKYVDSFDCFFAKFDSIGNTLQLSTLYGESGYDEANGIFYLDSVIYLVGRTASDKFPIIAAFDSTLTHSAGYTDEDGFLSIFTTKVLNMSAEIPERWSHQLPFEYLYENSGIFRIKNQPFQNHHCIITVFDLQGKTLGRTIGFSADLGNYPKGIYLIQVDYKNMCETIKLLK